MKKIVLFTLTYLSFSFLIAQTTSDSFITTFEKSDGTETATYQETITYYSKLAETYSEISIIEMGKTDSGKPLHIVIFNNDSKFNFSEIRKNKRVLLINNGIHPGESDFLQIILVRATLQPHRTPRLIEGSMRRTKSFSPARSGLRVAGQQTKDEDNANQEALDRWSDG